MGDSASVLVLGTRRTEAFGLDGFQGTGFLPGSAPAVTYLLRWEARDGVLEASSSSSGGAARRFLLFFLVCECGAWRRRACEGSWSIAIRTIPDSHSRTPTPIAQEQKSRLHRDSERRVVGWRFGGLGKGKGKGGPSEAFGHMCLARRGGGVCAYYRSWVRILNAGGVHRTPNFETRLRA